MMVEEFDTIGLHGDWIHAIVIGAIIGTVIYLQRAIGSRPRGADPAPRSAQCHSDSLSRRCSDDGTSTGFSAGISRVRSRGAGITR